MDKCILITGASRGIGFETARYLAGLGCTIVAVSRSAENLGQLQKEAPEQIYPLPLDITGKDTPDEIAQFLEKQRFRMDGLIHNAGLLINKPFSGQTDNDWQSQIAVNLLGPVRLTRNLLPLFSKNSHIVNISSMGGVQGSKKFAGLSAYSATKGALAVLTECLALELVGHNIFVNCLCLGAVQTEMVEQAFPGIEAPVNPGEMGTFVGDFVLKSHQFFNGKILPVALNNPD